ncbi:DALR anticodon-binding domain-containing protein [Tenggerimyces flavus]|uniref:DALR anticodon-binding domain-containing protein n=1 Tax=Tenggerimyces flavus TaxID=1708749 RepID=A0ABV7Y460_9ACTN|nr:DALR anticodon-binding domain-containing protein [Tenggerimyces flavus]MBM7790574.1 arginyl-tRNA synthetase [Tenggerimyces flavus]
MPSSSLPSCGDRPEFAAAEVTGAGYVNVRFRTAVFAHLLESIGPTYGGPAKTFAAPADEARYAYAMLGMVQRHAAALGLERGLDHPDVLQQRPERTLVDALGEYPAVIARATTAEPIVAVLAEIADLVPRFIEDRLAIPHGDDVPDDTHRTRLALVDATRVVLAHGLAALGQPASDRI